MQYLKKNLLDIIRKKCRLRDLCQDIFVVQYILLRNKEKGKEDT